jgi:ribonuclease HI
LVAFYDPQIKYYKMFQMNTHNISIMTTELIAISKALTYANNLDHQKVDIFTDSKSALQQLKNALEASDVLRRHTLY